MIESPGVERRGSLGDSYHLGMCGRVAKLFAAVVGRCQHYAISYDYRSHRNFVCRHGLLGLSQSHGHVLFVSHPEHPWSVN